MSYAILIFTSKSPFNLYAREKTIFCDVKRPRKLVKRRLTKSNLMPPKLKLIAWTDCLRDIKKLVFTGLIIYTFTLRLVYFCCTFSKIHIIEAFLYCCIIVICGALRDLVPFVQFRKRGKHPWRSVTFSKFPGWSLQLY